MKKSQNLSIIFYASGQFALMLQARFFFQWIIDFAAGPGTEVPLFAGDMIGLLLFSFRIFDAVTDPLAGKLGDYCFSRGISRKVLISWVAPLLPIGLVLVFLAKPEYSHITNWLLLSAGLFVFFVGYTLYCIPYWSLIDELSGGEQTLSTTLSSSLGQGLFLATAVGFVCTPDLVASFGHCYTAILIAVLTTPLLYLPRLADFGRSRIFSASSTQDAEPKLSMGGMLRRLLKPLSRREFLSVVFVFVGSQMAFTLLTSLAPIFVVRVLGEDRSYIKNIMGPVIILAIICFFFVPKLREKFTALNLIRFFSVLLAVLFLSLLSLLFVDPSSRALLSVVIFACMGPCLAVILGLEADAIARTAPRAEEVGMYFGTFNFLVKGMNGLALWMSGLAVAMSASVETSNGVEIIVYVLVIGGILTLGFVGLSAFLRNR